MGRCLKFKHNIEDVIAPYKKQYKDMQKKPKELKITSYFSPSFPLCSLHHLVMDNFQAGTLTSFHSIPPQMFLCLSVINLKIIVLHVSLVLITPSFPGLNTAHCSFDLHVIFQVCNPLTWQAVMNAH